MKRNPYADVGLVVAVAAFTVILIRSFIFGLSWAAIVCLLLTLCYFVLSAVRPSHSRTVRVGTTAYLLSLLLSIACVVLFDKNARPKMHAFEGAAVDTAAVEEFIVEDKDIPVEYTRPDTLDTDTLPTEASDSVVLSAGESQGQDTQTPESSPAPEGGGQTE